MNSDPQLCQCRQFVSPLGASDSSSLFRQDDNFPARFSRGRAQFPDRGHFADPLSWCRWLQPSLESTMKYQAVAAIASLFFAGLLTGCEFGVEETPVIRAQALPDENLLQAPAARAQRAARPGKPRVARGSLQFVEGYQRGYQQAANEGKPMLLFFTAEWCHFCHQMADEAFTHPQVVSLSERFVCILVNADLEPDVCRYFDVTGYPTIQFLSPRGVALERIVGKKPGHQLMMSMQAALQTVARKPDDGAEASAR